MSLSKGLKRKVDNDNKEEWRNNFAFILPGFTNGKPMCLICNEVVAVCKEYNVKRHHKTKHGSFNVAYPLLSEARKRKIQALSEGYAKSSSILMRGLTSQEKATSASLKASWLLARHNKPITDAELFKDVMIAVLEELADDKSMDGIIASVKQIPLSARSATRRIDALSNAVQVAVISDLNQAITSP